MQKKTKFKSLEELLIKGVTITIENEAQEQKGGCQSTANVLRNFQAGKWII